MARFTLSIADDVAAQLDAYASENNLNRSEAAEHIFRNAFQHPSDQVANNGDDEGEGESVGPQLVYVGASADLVEQFQEMRDYLTILYSRHETLRNYVLATVDTGQAPFGTRLPRALPEPSWVQRAQDG
jgi:metal-responsive CopG/Arc/MetJ family transcriptional regulator